MRSQHELRLQSTMTPIYLGSTRVSMLMNAYTHVEEVYGREEEEEEEEEEKEEEEEEEGRRRRRKRRRL